MSIRSIFSYFRQYDCVQKASLICWHVSNIKPAIKWHDYWYIYNILCSFEIPDHTRIQQLANDLLANGAVIGDFYLAQSLLLQNRLDAAEHHATRFFAANPKHAEGLYLLAEIKKRQNQKEAALTLLENFLTHSKRGKTWQHLSNLVDNAADFYRFHTLFIKDHPNYQQSVLAYDLSSHLTNAASRAGKVDFVLQFWRNQYQLFCKTKLTQYAKPPVVRRYSDIKAASALGDLKRVFNQAQLEFFLISGTLLGCIREGKLLGHDKDIDIGVWENCSTESLADIIYNSGCFYVLPIYSPDILVVRHVNGLTIDIFIHHREADDYWHAGGKSKWHNKPFELVEYAFLGEQYLIPKDYDRYLTENYGNWRTPNTEFDSVLDTPNMEIVSREAMLIYLYKRLLQKQSIKPSLYARLEQALRQYSV